MLDPTLTLIICPVTDELPSHLIHVNRKLAEEWSEECSEECSDQCSDQCSDHSSDQCSDTFLNKHLYFMPSSNIVCPSAYSSLSSFSTDFVFFLTFL